MHTHTLSLPLFLCPPPSHTHCLSLSLELPPLTHKHLRTYETFLSVHRNWLPRILTPTVTEHFPSKVGCSVKQWTSPTYLVTIINQPFSLRMVPVNGLFKLLIAQIVHSSFLCTGCSPRQTGFAHLASPPPPRPKAQRSRSQAGV